VCDGCIHAHDYGNPGPYRRCANCIRNSAVEVPQDYFTRKRRTPNASVTGAAKPRTVDAVLGKEVNP
jgi:hypothetical protein